MTAALAVSDLIARTVFSLRHMMVLAILARVAGKSTWAVFGIVLLLAAGLALTSCGDGDEDEYDEDEEPLVGSATQSPLPTRATAAAAPTAAPTPALGPTSAPDVTSGEPQSTLTPLALAGDLPRLTAQVDLLFTDLSTGELAFEVDAEAQFGNSPQGFIIPFEEGRDLQQMVRDNLQWLADRGYDEIEVYGVEGYGAVYLDSQVLASLRHQGFDYDSQYKGDPEDDELAVDEDEAFGRYYSVGNPLPMVMEEAHRLGIKVAVLIESLAHIINRAQGSGIGESGLAISGNLPPASVEQVLAFVDEVIATGADAISSEAFSIEYDTAIANHLAGIGIPLPPHGRRSGDSLAGLLLLLLPGPGEGEGGIQLCPLGRCGFRHDQRHGVRAGQGVVAPSGNGRGRWGVQPDTLRHRPLIGRRVLGRKATSH